MVVLGSAASKDAERITLGLNSSELEKVLNIMRFQWGSDVT